MIWLFLFVVGPLALLAIVDLVLRNLFAAIFESLALIILIGQALTGGIG